MSEQKKTIEEVMSQFVANEEKTGAIPSQKVSPAKKIQDNLAEQAKEHMDNRPTLAAAQEMRRDEIREETHSVGLGYVTLPVEDLPSGGIFYPAGTEFHVRAASGGDIRKWSMMNENELSQIDDALNNIVERCVSISFPKSDPTANWRDLKEVDRLYTLLAVRDFTFTDGHNELKISVSETQDVVCKKDNITFIDLPEKLLERYNTDKRCFTFKDPTTGKELNIYMPSVGVTQWLKGYIERKHRAQEPFDTDFITVAPMLISDWRKLNDKTYSELVMQSLNYTNFEWTVISRVKTVLERAISPKMTYNDESGVEQETPLNFRGGIKSLFIGELEDLGF